MRRGDIYLVDLEPAVGHGANKKRPAVLVTNDAANRMADRGGRGVLAVVPVTSNITQVRTFQVLLHAEDCGLKRDSKAQCEQIRALDLSRFGNRIGVVPPQIMKAIDRALRQQLAL
ncbi:type II toxin-antitoxin system PemK/MazF family toxin [Streptomyces griseorubiginosus]|uniref:type II toxin-antitoxin system PemK/MazF family toxin n=1 Tax=Streptomyces griseorubiginosus TaxID=67304 RepID=UPI001AD76BF0|nr:type II toxin-antitoxin system PemK/MazF family toxin [Streptomyces griseorubiginosus]MBO4255839.1 type II toxin-antitoxin system PemK/MazF family toxin [Streptomyces griseorubiginosus]